MAVAFNYETESRRVKEALREVFPFDTIATSKGWHGRVHVKIVSETFNGKTETEKQDIIWTILKEKLGPNAEVVSLALAYGTDEL